MRIALITPGFSASASDWCIPVLLDHVRELAREHEVHVFALRYPHRRDRYTVYGATVHPCGGADTRGLARGPLLGRAYRAIRAEARRRPFDLYHAFWADEPGALAVLAGRAAGRPAIVALMGGELVRMPELGYGGQLSRVNRVLTRLALGRATTVTVGSAYLREQALAYVAAERLVLQPLGVDTALFSPGPSGGAAPFERGRFNILQAASLLPIKDHRTSLGALQRLVQRHPQVQLHLVGQGPLRGQLERTAQQLGVAEHVTFHGAVDRSAMPDLYRAADLGLLSSRHESQALVIFEAAACGRATVGPAVGALPAILAANAAIPVGDQEALASAIAGLIADPGLLATRSAESLALAQGRFSLERSVAALNQLYTTAAGAFPAG